MLQRKVGVFPVVLAIVACGIVLVLIFNYGYPERKPPSRTPLTERASKETRIGRVELFYNESHVHISEDKTASQRVVYAHTKPPLLSLNERKEVENVIVSRLQEQQALASALPPDADPVMDVSPVQLNITILPNELENGIIHCKMTMGLTNSHFSDDEEFYTTRKTLLEDMLTHADARIMQVAIIVTNQHTFEVREYKRQPDGKIDVEIKKPIVVQGIGGGILGRTIFSTASMSANNRNAADTP